MHELETILKNVVVSGLRRKAVTTPSRWAQSYRMMGQPFPGMWAYNYHSWLRGMHEATHQICVGQKAAQLGYTEVVLNITFFKIDIERKDCLYVLPAKTPDASDFSASRFDAALELSPHLRNLFQNVKNVGHKRAGSANLYIRGSNSRGGLKSIPVAFIVFDELDEMNQDNISLAEERVSGQPSWQMWKISTPTAPNHGINKEFLLSTQDHFIFKCPCCSKQTELIFPECLKIEGEHRLDIKIKGTHLICKECGGTLHQEAKQDFLKNGIWVPFGEKQADRRGFYINQLYSSTIQPWKIADLYFAAQVDKAAEQEFFNSKLGLPHVPEGAQVTDIEISEAIGPRVKSDPAPIGKLITMGVDQGTWLHYEVAAWDFPRLGNDLNMNASCEVLAEGKVLDFTELAQLMRQWQIRMCVIDAQPERRLAYEFAVKHWGHVKLCYYSVGASGNQIVIDQNDETHKVSVDRTSWLDVAFNRFHNKTITLPKDLSIEYRAHIKNQIRRYRKDANNNPVGEYISIGDDHLGHARCYDEIALPLAASLNTNTDIKAFL